MRGDTARVTLVPAVPTRKALLAMMNDAPALPASHKASFTDSVFQLRCGLLSCENPQVG